MLLCTECVRVDNCSQFINKIAYFIVAMLVGKSRCDYITSSVSFFIITLLYLTLS